MGANICGDNHVAVIDRIRERLERMEQILLDPVGPHKWQKYIR